MEDTSQVESVESRWEILKQSDNDRQQLFERIIHELKRVESENRGLHEKIRAFEYHEKNYIRDMRKFQEDYQVLQGSAAGSAFVLVLIDGDSTMFNDNYIKDGFEGGHRAASDLHAKLSEYCKTMKDYSTSWEIIVRLYVKLEGQARAYVSAGIVDNTHTVHAFYRGFNEVYPLFEAIDAGNDKEGADSKVKRKYLSEIV